MESHVWGLWGPAPSLSIAFSRSLIIACLCIPQLRRIGVFPYFLALKQYFPLQDKFLCGPTADSGSTGHGAPAGLTTRRSHWTTCPCGYTAWRCPCLLALGAVQWDLMAVGFAPPMTGTT